MTIRTRPTAGLLGATVLLALSLYGFAYSVNRVRALGFFDFPIFVEAAAGFLETGELYPAAADTEAWGPAAAVYKFPPLYAMLLLPVVRLAPAATLSRANWGLQIALYLLAVALLYRWLRPREGDLRLGLVLLVLALNFQPFIETLWGLQVETLLLLLLVLGLGFVARGNAVAAGASLGLTVMLKVYPAPLLVYFLARRRWTALLAAGTVIASVLLLGLVVIGPDQNAAYFFDILPVLLREPPSATTENVGIGRYAQTWWGLTPSAARWVSRALALCLLTASTLLVASRPESRDRRDAMLELSLFVPALLLTLPNSWTNYQLLLLPPLLVLVAHALAEPTRRGLLVPVLAAYGLMMFLRPCELAGWPCDQTPAVFGLFVVPRPLHDLAVRWRGVCPLLLWLATVWALRGARYLRPRTFRC